MQKPKVLTDNQGKHNNTKVEHIFHFSRLKICTNSRLSSAFTYALDCLLISVQAPVYSSDISVQRGIRFPLVQAVNTKDTRDLHDRSELFRKNLRADFALHKSMGSNVVIPALPPTEYI